MRQPKESMTHQSVAAQFPVFTDEMTHLSDDVLRLNPHSIPEEVFGVLQAVMKGLLLPPPASPP